MATKVPNKELEATLVALMESSHEALDGLNFKLKSALNSLLSDFIIEVATLPEGAIYRAYILAEQLRMDVMTLIEPYLIQYEDMLEEASEEAINAVLGHISESNGITHVESMENSYEIARQAREKTMSIIVAMISQLTDQAYQLSQGGVTAGVLDNLTSTKDSLIYQLRRHFEALMSYTINNSISQTAEKNNYTHYYWQIRPELTRSGTCEVCKAHSKGGVDHDGVYTLEDVPTIPVHPHCVCILIPMF